VDDFARQHHERLFSRWSALDRLSVLLSLRSCRGSLFGFLGACPIQSSGDWRGVPVDYAGRVTTSSNFWFSPWQLRRPWGIGKVVDLWPRTAAATRPDGYSWAFRTRCSSFPLAGLGVAASVAWSVRCPSLGFLFSVSAAQVADLLTGPDVAPGSDGFRFSPDCLA